MYGFLTKVPCWEAVVQCQEDKGQELEGTSSETAFSQGLPFCCRGRLSPLQIDIHYTIRTASVLLVIVSLSD